MYNTDVYINEKVAPVAVLIHLISELIGNVFLEFYVKVEFLTKLMDRGVFFGHSFVTIGGGI